MLRVCQKSQSEFFEPNSYSRIAEFPNLLDRHNNSFGEKSFWLNVLITNAGNVQYHSDAPLSTVFENDPQLSVAYCYRKRKMHYFQCRRKNLLNG